MKHESKMVSWRVAVKHTIFNGGWESVAQCKVLSVSCAVINLDLNELILEGPPSKYQSQRQRFWAVHLCLQFSSHLVDFDRGASPLEQRRFNQIKLKLGNSELTIWKQKITKQRNIKNLSLK